MSKFPECLAGSEIAASDDGAGVEGMASMVTGKSAGVNAAAS